MISPALLLLLALAAEGDPYPALRAPARGEREAAVEALARAGPPADALLGRFREEKDPLVACGILEALRLRGDAAALRALLDAALHEDPDRGCAAAAALLRAAIEAGEPMGGAALERAGAVRARLLGPAREAVEEWLLLADEHPDYDASLLFRRITVLGPLAEEPLRDAACDRARLWTRRRIAILGLARLLSEGAAESLAPLLDDPEPMVRAAAADTLLRVGSTEGLVAVARTLGRDRLMEHDVQRSAMAAIERLGEVDGPGARRLYQVLSKGTVEDALAAASALRRARPVESRDAIRAAAERLLEREEKQPGTGVQAVLFDLRAGPLDASVRERMARSASPLLRAAGLEDREEALRTLRGLLAPERPLPRFEYLRVPIALRLLVRLDAPAEDRLLFAEANLRTDAPVSRASAARALAGVPSSRRASLAPVLEALLDDPRESVRLAAAAQLPPLPKARAALLGAIVDGNPAATAEAIDLLSRFSGTSPLPAPGDPVGSRRAAARRLWEEP